MALPLTTAGWASRYAARLVQSLRAYVNKKDRRPGGYGRPWMATRHGVPRDCLLETYSLRAPLIPLGWAQVWLLTGVLNCPSLPAAAFAAEER